MAAEAEKNEADILRTLRRRYERNGYTFISFPTIELLPDFLKGYRPDAIALSKTGSRIIEIKKSRSPSSERSLAEIAERVASHPDWKFDVYYVGEFSRPAYETPDVIEIHSLVEEVQRLVDGGFTRPALVMAWAALEATSRALQLDGDKHSAPMIPSEIVEWLARNGHIDPPTARFLRHMIKTRNAIVHGDQAVDVQGHELIKLISILNLLSLELVEASNTSKA